MSAVLPVGLTYLLEAGTGNVTLGATDIVFSSGKTGPLLLKLTNSSDTAVAVVSYDNELIPQPIVTYTNIILVSNYGSATVDITVDPANYIPYISRIVSADSNNFINNRMQTYGQLIGGQQGFVFFTVVNTTNPGGMGTPTEIIYDSGYVPANTGGAILPTAGTPTKVFTIAPLTSEIVQIPASDNGSTVLVASGADVYVTPVQIVG